MRKMTINYDKVRGWDASSSDMYDIGTNWPDKRLILLFYAWKTDILCFKVRILPE